MTDSEDPRHLAHEELTAAGVPRWAQQAALEGVTVARYYAWVDNGVVDGRLLLPLGSDEAAAIDGLLAQCNQILTAGRSGWPPMAVELTHPAAVLVIRPNGHARGGPFHPKTGPFRLDTDLVPLERLIRQAMDVLSQRRRKIRPRRTLDVPERDTPRT